MIRITNKKVGICCLSFILGFVIAALSVVAYAYFSKKEIYDGYLSGSIELLFDRLDDDGIAAYREAEGILADKTAEWGSKENPYVISTSKHLYNLSTLQNLGYFEKKHLSQNTDGNLTYIPYFLVCNTDYTPVVIDGSATKAISPIGNKEYPFIGSVKGVKGTGTVTVGANSSDTSMLHAVSVKGNPADPDVGLFGYVSFLGTLTDEPTFAGTPSVISNLVISDVTVSVNSSLWDKIEAFIVDIALDASGHRYSFSELQDTDNYNNIPHENHHIGILAGHVSYSTVEYISVFYSSGSVVAIDLSDSNKVGEEEANYLSAAGILGFIYNMNPKIDSETGNIIANSGDSLSDLSYSMVGGGGLEVGDKPGYILASDMYKKYGYIVENNTVEEIPVGATLKIAEATDSEGNPLCQEWESGISLTGNGTSYYFYDGVFTFALSSEDDVIEQTWENDTAPEFAIVLNDPSGWVTNSKEGQKSVAAYLRKITSDKELQDAIQEGLPLVIMHETSANSAFMMKLYDQSVEGSGDFNEKYTTAGSNRVYATDEDIASLFESLEGAEADAAFAEEFLAGFDNAKTLSQVRTLLNNVQNDKNNWKLINLKATAGDMTKDEMEAAVQVLREQFKISSKYVKGEYSYFYGNVPIAKDNSGVKDYYDYADSEYDGYIYYVKGELDNIFTGYNYTYYWQDKSGESRVIGTSKEWTLNITNTLTETGESWQGETVYEKTVDGVTYKGVVINAATGQFHGQDNSDTAIANGQYLQKLTGGTVNYFYSPLGKDVYYYMTDDDTEENAINPDDLVATGENTAAGLPYYSYTKNGTTYTGILLDRYYIYNFYSEGKTANTSDDNYLRIVKAQFLLSGTRYTLWNGTDSEANNTSNFKGLIGVSASSVDNRVNATVRFNDDGTCYIQYGIDTVTQFVNYNGSAFNTAVSNTDNAKLCIYILEDTQALNVGRITYDPANETDHYVFSAGEYVLWPESESVSVQDANPSSVTDGVNTQYSVIELDDLQWRNGDATDNNGILHKGNLYKKFRMIDGINFGLNLDLFGITNLGTGGLVRAPVGPEGTYTDIPSGGIAFKINKTSTEPQKIRVLVAVPVSEYFIGEDDYELGDYPRYFCLWEMEENDGSGSAIFQAGDYIERFEIPRSHPYEPGTSASSITSEYVTITYGGKEYRSYLNGDRVLVAYEFKVYNEGVYVLGTATNASDDGGISLEARDDAPLEIVYFSADGVASSGRDGQSGSQLGTIDYVYSYNNVIVPVESSSSTDDNGDEDYTTYYPSYCMLYMNSNQDGNFVDINNERVYIHRYVEENPPTSSEGFNTTKSYSVIGFKIEADKYTRLIQYSRLADNVKKEE